MKPTQILLTCLVGVSIAAGASNAQSTPEPVLNIQVVDGFNADNSSRQRKIRLLRPSADNSSVLLPTERSIEIPYDESDPLFSTSEFTWILRAKFSQPFVTDQYIPVMGQWFLPNDERSAGLVLGPDRRLNFALSSDGTKEGVVGAGCKTLLEENEWRIFVFRWKQNESVSLSIYADDGTEVETTQAKHLTHLPASLKQVAQPFLVGAPAQCGMEIKSVRVFDRALDDEELTPDLLTK